MMDCSAVSTSILNEPLAQYFERVDLESYQTTAIMSSQATETGPLTNTYHIMRG